MDEKRFPTFERLERAVLSFGFKETDWIAMISNIKEEARIRKYPSRELIIKYLKFESEHLPPDYQYH